MASRVELGTAAAEPGERARGLVEAVRRADGEATHLPILIINGAKSGPRLWLSACHHGDEVGGAVAVFRVFERIEARDLAGTIIALPVCNPTAFRAKQRCSPIDNKDLERAFPGNPMGSYTEQLAHAIHQLVLANAECLVDLHGSLMKELKIVDQAFFDYFTPGVKESNRALAEAMACEYVCGVPAKEYWGGVGLQCFLLGSHGISAVLSESDDPESHYKDIRNILVHLSMLDGELVRRPKIYQKTLHLLTATRSGIFVPEVDLYQRVDKDQLLARILNPSGEVVEEIRCPIPNGLVVTIRTFPTVEAVWEKTIQGTTLEKAGLFEIGELASW